MKPQDLRIGNFTSMGEVSQIEDYCFYVTGEDGSSFKNKWADIQPILLTEQWLIKLGFSQREEGDFSYRPTFDVQYIAGFHENKLWFMVYTQTAHTGYLPIYLKNPIEYVHQLQNLHYTLVGEEI